MEGMLRGEGGGVEDGLRSGIKMLGLLERAWFAKDFFEDDGFAGSEGIGEHVAHAGLWRFGAALFAGGALLKAGEGCFFFGAQFGFIKGGDLIGLIGGLGVLNRGWCLGKWRWGLDRLRLCRGLVFSRLLNGGLALVDFISEFFVDVLEGFRDVVLPVITSHFFDEPLYRADHYEEDQDDNATVDFFHGEAG